MAKRICVFGASTTHGTGDDKMGGWVNRLKVSLEKDDFQIYNLGIPGATTEMLLERTESEAKPRRPNIIIFALGMNDSSFRKDLGRNFVLIDDYKDNLEKLNKIAQGFTDKVLFVGSTLVDEEKTNPIKWNTNFFYKNEKILEYDEAIKGFCKENNLLFIEISTLLNDSDDLADGIHPNAQGHEKIYKKVRNFLIENKII